MPAPSHLTRSQWRGVIVAGYLPTLATSMGFGAVLPLVALSATHLGATVGQAALIVGLSGLGTLLADLPAGHLAARVGEKWAMVGACLVQAALLALAWRASSLIMLGIAVLGWGMTGSVFGLARQTFLTEAVPAHARGRALSTLGGVFRVGGFVGPLAGSVVIARWGLPAAYAFAAALSLVAAGINLAVPDIGREADRADAPGDDGTGLLSILARHRRALLTLGTGALMIQFVRVGRQVVVPLWCQQAGLSPAATSLIYSASMACDVLLFLPGGWLMDRAGRWWLCVPSLTVMSGGMMLIPLTHGPLAITAVAMLLGVGNGVSAGIVMTLGSDASPAVGRPQFLGAFRLLADGGAALSPLVISAVTGVTSLAVATVVVGVAGLAGTGWLTAWVPRRRKVSP